MKLYGIAGKGSGRLGSHVYAINGGEQIVRAYNPVVTNPSTDKQVVQRGKFKLLTQLAAAMAPVIVIPKKGTTSARNLFVSKNIAIATVSNNTAQVEYEKLQLTNGIASMEAVVATAVQGTGINVELASSMGGAVDRVVYAMFQKTVDGKLQYVDSVVANTAGADGKFAATLPEADSEAVIYAYGMKDNSTGAKARYDDYEVETGEDIATLIATRNLKASDYTFTATEGVTVPFEGSWVNPYPAAYITIDDDTEHIGIDETVELPLNPDYIKIHGLTESDVVSGTANGTDMLFQFASGIWKNFSTGPELPVEIKVNGVHWFDVTWNE